MSFSEGFSVNCRCQNMKIPVERERGYVFSLSSWFGLFRADPLSSGNYEILKKNLDRSWH